MFKKSSFILTGLSLMLASSSFAQNFVSVARCTEKGQDAESFVIMQGASNPQQGLIASSAPAQTENMPDLSIPDPGFAENVAITETATTLEVKLAEDSITGSYGAPHLISLKKDGSEFTFKGQYRTYYCRLNQN